jgi:hypothetical protein
MERDPHTITDDEVKKHFVEQCDEGFAPGMTEDQFIRDISFIRYAPGRDAAVFRVRCEYEVIVPLEEVEEEVE